MNALTLLLGGARSGKSSLAVEMGLRFDGPVTYLATAAALDDDMTQRIARHRDERPADWHTIEEQTDLMGALDAASADAPGTMTIIDCLTLWTTNLLMAGHTDDDVRSIATATAEHAARSATPVVAISNEVGLGVHPETELGRRYRDLLGWVNQAWASTASESLFLVAGRVLRLDDPWAAPGTRHDDAPT
ncbi:MAG: bifunctional adenosylcobinamide kinase/adenosylcobinamide-phosphate guanylyltransferase [Ilumatobacteraceae bacterium]